MTLYNELFLEFRGYNSALIGISVDGVWCHLAFARDRKLQFPLLADFEPKGAIARTYGVCERALFVIDPVGTIRWSYVSPIGINPGADGILAALEDLSNQEASR
jgi:peroxiredoxin